MILNQIQSLNGVVFIRDKYLWGRYNNGKRISLPIFQEFTIWRLRKFMGTVKPYWINFWKDTQRCTPKSPADVEMHNTDVTMAVFVTTVLVGDMSAKTHDQTCTSALMQLHLMTNASYRRSGKWADIALNNRDYSRSLKQSRFPRPLQAGNPPYKSQGPSSVSCGALFTENRIPLYRSTVNLVNYIWRTAPLTSKVAFYIFIQQIYVLNILNMVYTLRFFSLQNAVCFIILTYLVPVLFTFYIQCVLKLKK
jgi:hypothetical protein